MSGGKQGTPRQGDRGQSCCETARPKRSDGDPVRRCTARCHVFCPLCPKVFHESRELARIRQIAIKVQPSFYCNGSSLSSFHRPFPKSASCSVQGGVELPRIASPPPHPSLHVSASLGRNPHLTMGSSPTLYPLVIIIITLSFLRFNREPHIYPGAHPPPIVYRYPQ